MIKKYTNVFMLILSLGLVSCASTSGFPERVVSVDDELESLRYYFEKGRFEEYNKPCDKKNVCNEFEERRRIRDEIINGRIAGIDVEFSLFQKKLREQGVGLNVGTDAALLALGAAGALATGGATQALSATSAALTGLRGSVDKNVFYQEAMPALFAKMIAKRKAVLVNIRRGLNEDTSQYPLQQGIADLEEYLYAGTIPGAISAVTESAGVEAHQADKKLEGILIDSRYEETLEGDLLEKWMSENEEAHERVLSKWLKDKGYQCSSATLMYGDKGCKNNIQNKDIRNEAIKSLKTTGEIQN